MPEEGLYESLCEGCGGYIVHSEDGERQTEYPVLDVITLEPIQGGEK